MTQTADLLAAAVAALKGATLAEDRVYSALTWPTTVAKYPLIYCKTPTEEKESLSRNGPPQFTVTATLKVEARMQVGALPNGQSAALLEQKLDQMSQQIQVALINNPTLMGSVQRFAFIRTEMATNSTGNQELGEVEVAIGLEFYQGPEDFYPLPAIPLEQMHITTDLLNRFDATGVYPDPAFPDAVVPAPRDSGPDGRAEGDVLINLNP
jgi:hypothetical protein